MLMKLIVGEISGLVCTKQHVKTCEKAHDIL